MWNEDICRFKQGDNVRIVNGFVNEFQGEAQLTSGKFGRIDKVGENTGSSKDENPKIANDFEEPEEDFDEDESIEEVEY